MIQNSGDHTGRSVFGINVSLIINFVSTKFCKSETTGMVLPVFLFGIL